MSEPYTADDAAPADMMEGADAQAMEPAEGTDHSFLQQAINNPNLAHDLDGSILNSIGAKVCEEFETDEESLKAEGWWERAETAMKLALQTKEEKSYPWPKASNVKYPLISTAAIQFNARAYPAVVSGPNVVKCQVEGQPSPEKQAKAERVGDHMSYQLLQEMDGWEEDTDRLLIMLPVVGCVFRKTYFDPVKGYNCSHIVPPTKFIANYWTRDLDSCPRFTHVLEFYPNEIATKMRSGLWRQVDLGQPEGANNDDQAPHTFLEQYRLWDLDGDDYPEPYIVTVHKETQAVVRIVARYDEKGVQRDGKGQVVCIEPIRVFTKYPFILSPDGAFYDIGFGTLLNPLSETINSTINQLMDAGHLANVQGGFIGEGVSIKSGNMRFAPGEWKKAGAVGGSLKDNIVPLPVKEPSSVLFELMNFLIASAKDVTATQDILTGDMVKSNQPVGTTLAVIEQGLKTYTAIVKRVHRAFKKELDVLFRLNARYLNPQVYFTFQDTPKAVAQQDYAEGDMDVVPVSDPSMATDMQKMGRAQFLMQFIGKGLNDQEIIRRVLEAASIPEIDKVMQGPPPPPDPKLAEAKDKIDLAHRKQDTEDAKALSEIAVNEANAQATMMQTIMASPQFADLVAQFIDQRVHEQLTGIANGAAVHGADLSGMGQPPADQGLPGLPPGPAGPPQGPMGAGPGDGPPPPDQGAPFGGAGQPGMG